MNYEVKAILEVAAEKLWNCYVELTPYGQWAVIELVTGKTLSQVSAMEVDRLGTDKLRKRASSLLKKGKV